MTNRKLSQPNPPKIKKKLWPNPADGWTQPMTDSGIAAFKTIVALLRFVLKRLHTTETRLYSTGPNATKVPWSNASVESPLVCQEYSLLQSVAATRS